MLMGFNIGADVGTPSTCTGGKIPIGLGADVGFLEGADVGLLEGDFGKSPIGICAIGMSSLIVNNLNGDGG